MQITHKFAKTLFIDVKLNTVDLTKLLRDSGYIPAGFVCAGVECEENGYEVIVCFENREVPKDMPSEGKAGE